MQTARLNIRTLNVEDTDFIYQLLNTPTWIEFIGDRNVRSPEDARNYIQKILDDSQTLYWVVQQTENLQKIGVITILKRDYLNAPDIGFAFLPSVLGKGYAQEATQAVLNYLQQKQETKQVLAICLPHNFSSLRLLDKLGFIFQKEITVGREKLLLYALQFSSKCS